jgi:hypothetical protein
MNWGLSLQNPALLLVLVVVLEAGPTGCRARFAWFNCTKTDGILRYRRPRSIGTPKIEDDDEDENNALRLAGPSALRATSLHPLA